MTAGRSAALESEPGVRSGRTEIGVGVGRSTNHEAAIAMNRMKPATLARLWSAGGNGPPCRHIRAKPYYPRGLLRAWAMSQMSEVRTAAPPAARRPRDRRAPRRLGRRRSRRLRPYNSHRTLLQRRPGPDDGNGRRRRIRFRVLGRDKLRDFKDAGFACFRWSPADCASAQSAKETLD